MSRHLYVKLAIAPLARTTAKLSISLGLSIYEVDFK